AVPLALALVTFIFIVTSVGELPQSSQTIQSYDPTLLSQNLFGADGPWLLLLGLLMMGAVAGSIYLVREGRE
ncbi:MAG: hypothetical protein ACLPWO_06815, partial [Thermoplasmata archaeon]